MIPAKIHWPGLVGRLIPIRHDAHGLEWIVVLQSRKKFSAILVVPIQSICFRQFPLRKGADPKFLVSRHRKTPREQGYAMYPYIRKQGGYPTHPRLFASRG